ncbi:hypothetical protein AB0M22_44925 [Nocardia sp. NPDC051756]|uniref:hypothetical protein n=1 Tax=Nocardia sp. NPDC051756 TaxID=3154751 RepID=UPI003430BBD5
MSELLRLPDGRVIAAGDEFKDKKREVPRLLRVESISDTPWRDWKGHEHYLVTLVVVGCRDGQEVVLRKTVIDADALLSGRDYVSVHDEDNATGVAGDAEDGR